MRIDFADDFTILDGRNGVGKSTIFDAIEYALTGHLSKYKDAKADGETVADYIWWTGRGSAPADRYVEAGFRDQDGVISIRRTEFQPPDDSILIKLAARLCDIDLAPRDPLSQLCYTSIIRDEHIAGLSLDLKETERYALLRDGLGVNDSDSWVSRGAQLLAATKKRSQMAQQEVAALNSDLTASTRRIDEARAELLADNVITDAVARLRVLTRSEAAPDQLAGPVREWIARTGEEIASLQRLASNWEAVERERQRMPELARNREVASSEVAAATKTVDALRKGDEVSSSTELAKQARDLIALASLGRSLGLRDGHCPLCQLGQAHDHYLAGIAVAEDLAKTLDLKAAEEAQQEQAARAADARLAAARQQLANAEATFVSAKAAIQEFDALRQTRDSGDLQTWSKSTRSRLSFVRNWMRRNAICASSKLFD